MRTHLQNALLARRDTISKQTGPVLLAATSTQNANCARTMESASNAGKVSSSTKIRAKHAYPTVETARLVILALRVPRGSI